MIRFLILSLLSASAWAAIPVTQCWDGLAWTGQVDNCPVFIGTPSGGSGITDTTANVSAVLDRQADTLYYYVQTATGTCPTKPVTMVAMVNGTGAAKSGYVTDVGPGFVEIPLTGLTAEQEYCVTFLAVSGGQPSVATVSPGIYFFQSSPWQQLAADPGEPTPGQDLELLNARFVGAGGSNTAGCGADHVNRCATLAGLGTNTPGTDIYLYSGTVDTSTTPFVLGWSGSPTDPVIIDSYYLDASNGNQATAYNEGSGNGRGDRWTWRPSALLTGSGNGITIQNLSYVYISNIVLDGVGEPTTVMVPTASPQRFIRWIRLENAPHIHIHNSVFQRARGYSCISLEGASSYARITNNGFHFCGSLKFIDASGVINAWGDTIGMSNDSTYALIEQNKFSKCSHNCIGAYGGRMVVRKNTFRSDWDDIWGSNSGYRIGEFSTRTAAETNQNQGRYLIELNDFQRIGRPDPASGTAPYLKMISAFSIYRNNIFSNEGNPIHSLGVNMELCCNTKRHGQNQRIYNNTFDDLNSTGFSIRSNYIAPATNNPARMYGNVVKNNVLSSLNSGSRHVYAHLIVENRNNASDPWDGNSFVSNCFEQTNASTFRQVEGVTQTIAQAESSFPSLFFDNVTAAGCRTLETASDLTTVTSDTGSGTTFTVADSLWFSDGNGLVDPDTIAIGGVTRQIVSINRSTHAITVDSSVSWTNGAAVNLACNDGSVKFGQTCGAPGADW
jgi:hypothetical protein